MTPRTHEMLCGACRRRATGIGVTLPPSHKPVIWSCGDPECITLIRNTFSMSNDKLQFAEEIALRDGALAAVEEYLNTIGKTDFADFTAEEVMEFARRFELGRQKALKAELQAKVPF
jgi:hypothetical protein